MSQDEAEKWQKYFDSMLEQISKETFKIGEKNKKYSPPGLRYRCIIFEEIDGKSKTVEFYRVCG